MNAIKTNIPSLHDLERTLERLKNHFLAAMYEKDAACAQSALQSVHDLVFEPGTFSDRGKPGLIPLSETSEKLLNQICRACKKLKTRLPNFAQKSLDPVYSSLRQGLIHRVRDGGTPPDFTEFEPWISALKLTAEQKDLLFKTAMTFQLTKGCSNFCRRCNEWALPKVRGHFSLGGITKILQCMADQGNLHISLFGASDPLDWEEGEKNLADINRIAQNKEINASLLTKAPKGKIDLLRELITDGADLFVSVTSRNKNRIRKLEDTMNLTLGKQHDTDDLLIPACLDEDFTSVKPSITDGYGTEITPDGAYIVIPTFTSALHPFGHQKIPVTPDTRFFPLKKTGRHALLVDYFKPLDGYDADKAICHLDGLMPVQIETILLDSGFYELTPPGMRSVKEYLEIFETEARNRRKKMTLSVLKKLKAQYVKEIPFQKLSQKKQKEFKTLIRSHLSLCRKADCLQARNYAVSFFLKEIANYVAKHGDRTKIIRFLVEQEFSMLAEKNADMDKSPEHLLSDETGDAFTLFRHLALSLVFCSCFKSAATAFVRRFPSAYDPVSDLFVKKE